MKKTKQDFRKNIIYFKCKNTVFYSVIVWQRRKHDLQNKTVLQTTPRIFLKRFKELQKKYRFLTIVRSRKGCLMLEISMHTI